MSQAGQPNASISQEGPRIAVSLRQRWRLFRSRTLPVLGFLGVAVLTAWMWGRQPALLVGVGAVEVVRSEVAAANGGRLAALPGSPWRLFETVDANQVLAQLDDQELRAALEVSRQELVRLQKELVAAGIKLKISEADRGQNHQAETIRLRVDLERARLTTLNCRTQTEIDTVELQRHNVRLECLQPLYVKKIIADLEMNNERLLQQEAARRLEQNRKTLREAESAEGEAAVRLKQFPALLSADVEKELAPIVAAADVQCARIRELETQLALLTIRAPIRGMICAIHHWPGENVRAGDPIITLADDHGRYIVSYVRQEQRIEPRAGMAVAIRKRVAAGRPVTTVVERVGAQVEPVPAQHCRDPKAPEWGLPVRIALPQGFLAAPGELLDVSFQSQP